MNRPRDIPELYLNRELGQLAFNRRVLAQAENRATPLLERLRFLCIVSSNLDEFFEIRVSGLHAEIEAGSPVIGPDRMRADKVFAQVATEAHELVAAQTNLTETKLRSPKVTEFLAAKLAEASAEIDRRIDEQMKTPATSGSSGTSGPASSALIPVPIRSGS